MKVLDALANGVVFDGVAKPYVPPAKLNVSPKLKLQTAHDEEIDPVTYEVIRHSLWSINEEHGSTIMRISGSPVAIYAIDLNPSILTEDAEFVYFGPYMQYMSGVTDTQVKWILENRSDNPGIADGDMFLAFPKLLRAGLTRRLDREFFRNEVKAQLAAFAKPDRPSATEPMDLGVHGSRRGW